MPHWNPRQIRLSEELLYKKIGVVRLRYTGNLTALIEIYFLNREKKML